MERAAAPELTGRAARQRLPGQRHGARLVDIADVGRAGCLYPGRMGPERRPEGTEMHCRQAQRRALQRRILLSAAFATIAGCAVSQPVGAPPSGSTGFSPPSSPPAQEWIPTPFVEDGRPVRLELLVRKPTGTGPFPTVVFNHGSTGRGHDPSLFTRSWWSAPVAEYFVERGWMVLFPQRRGRGASGGRYDEGFTADRRAYSCEAALSLPGIDRALQDLDAVMGHVRTRTDVRQESILIAGQSRGGILSVAYAGERPDAFVGVVNFVGGWVGTGCRAAGLINTTAFRRGVRFPRPMLWLYGEDDEYYPLGHSRSNFDAFLAAGGKGTFESRRVPGRDRGHGLIRYPELWRDPVDRYLETLR